MNKILLLFCLTCKTFAATPSSEAVIILESTNHRGNLIEKSVVIIDAETVMVNGEKLSAKEIITQSPYLNEITIFKKQTDHFQCNAGMFKHILKKGKTIKVEKGCLFSDRYNELKKSFKALKKDRITQ